MFLGFSGLRTILCWVLGLLVGLRAKVPASAAEAAAELAHDFLQHNLAV